MMLGHILSLQTCALGWGAGGSVLLERAFLTADKRLVQHVPVSNEHAPFLLISANIINGANPVQRTRGAQTHSGVQIPAPRHNTWEPSD